MTDKEKLKALFIDWLKQNVSDKYPNIPPEDIAKHLKPLYLLMEEKGLKPQGLTFEKFFQIAELEYNKARFNVQFHG